MTRLPERWFFACVKRAWLAMVIVAAAPSVCSAQAASASTLKAAFTLNFLKFAEWPDLKPGQPILVCVSGEEQIASAIIQATSGRPVDDHAIRVLRIAPGGAVRDCNLLFVTDREPQGLATILEEARPFPMLTVSDAHESAEHGAIIELVRRKRPPAIRDQCRRAGAVAYQAQLTARQPRKNRSGYANAVSLRVRSS